MRKKRSLWLCLLLAAVLALSLLTGCAKGSASTQENSAVLHSVSSEAEETQQDTGQQDGKESDLVLYEDEDLQDDVYAEDEGPPETEEDTGQTADAAQDQGQAADVSQDQGQAEEAAIDENGSYTTKDDVALYIHTYGKLPSNFITKKEAQRLGWTGGSLEPYAPGKCIGGNHFGNYEGILPDGNYKECDIDTLGKKSRGAKRIIYSDDGRIYYTEDHYESFTQLY